MQSSIPSVIPTTHDANSTSIMDAPVIDSNRKSIPQQLYEQPMSQRQPIAVSSQHPPTPPEDPPLVLATSTIDMSAFRDLLARLWRKGLEVQPRINGVWRAGINDWRVCGADGVVVLEEHGPSKQATDEVLKKRSRVLMNGWGDASMEKEDMDTVASKYKRMRFMMQAQVAQQAAAVAAAAAAAAARTQNIVNTSQPVQSMAPIPIAPNPIMPTLPIMPGIPLNVSQPTATRSIDNQYTYGGETQPKLPPLIIRAPPSLLPAPAKTTPITEASQISGILDGFFPTTVSSDGKRNSLPALDPNVPLRGIAGPSVTAVSGSSGSNVLSSAEQQAIEDLFDL